MKSVFALGALFLITFSACKKNYTCSNQDLQVAFVGYPYTEVDTVTLNTYARGSNFTQLLRTETLHAFNMRYGQTADSIFISSLSITMAAHHDFELVNAFDNKKMRVSDVIWREEEGRRGTFSIDQCISPIISYKRDGTAFTPNASAASHILLAINR